MLIYNQCTNNAKPNEKIEINGKLTETESKISVKGVKLDVIVDKVYTPITGKNGQWSIKYELEGSGDYSVTVR